LVLTELFSSADDDLAAAAVSSGTGRALLTAMTRARAVANVQVFILFEIAQISFNILSVEINGRTLTRNL